MEGFNNRLYLRATTADGRVLSGVAAQREAPLGADRQGHRRRGRRRRRGRLQVDPGPGGERGDPRAALPPAAEEHAPSTAQRARPTCSPTNGEASARRPAGLRSLRGQARAVRPLRARAAASRRWWALRGARHGPRCSATAVPAGRLGRCIGTRARPASRSAPARSACCEARGCSTTASCRGSPPRCRACRADADAIQTALERGDGRRARLPALDVPSGELSRMLSFEQKAGSREVALSFIADAARGRTSPTARSPASRRACPRLTLPRQPADEPDDAEGEGSAGTAAWASRGCSVRRRRSTSRCGPQATMMTGYEFLVTAKAGKEGARQHQAADAARARCRRCACGVGLAAAEAGREGDGRGAPRPRLPGELPEEAVPDARARAPRGRSSTRRRARPASQLPPDFEGWGSVPPAARSPFFFVQPKARLTVKLKPEKPRYAPGQLAQLLLDHHASAARAARRRWASSASTRASASSPPCPADELSGLRPQVQLGAAPSTGSTRRRSPWGGCGAPTPRRPPCCG